MLPNEGKPKRKGGKGTKVKQNKIKKLQVKEVSTLLPCNKKDKTRAKSLLILSKKTGNTLFRSPKITFYRKGTITLHNKV